MCLSYLQVVPHLLVDYPMAIGVADRSVDVELLVHVAIPHSHPLQVDLEVLLPVDDPGGQSWHIDSAELF